MLRLTKKADYGLMAMKLLAERQHQPAVSAKEISDEYHVPLQLLAKVLQQLTRSGLLDSHAGTHGGYSLAKPPHEISAFEVIRAIDGPLFITACTTGRKSCDLHDSCTVKEPLQRLNDTFRDVLTGLRISDLAQPDGHLVQAAHGKNLVQLVAPRHLT
jgi:Rrf2 family protein